ncbi:MAG: hypothetical protein COB67_08715 [SAR324 cluster bacterium]|uniref:Uncharacterized protein n=1 Tax=SAR324 cluster bacterium TaxID=2024889 RepID=A0A2A4T126_9DELT|nr:MAG: hypothetical protein COB67_08715 [SAR324 cluster bacterium]
MPALRLLTALRPALNVALGAGLTLGTTYIGSRLKGNKETASRLERMERMIETLAKLDAKEQ